MRLPVRTLLPLVALVAAGCAGAVLPGAPVQQAGLAARGAFEPAGAVSEARLRRTLAVLSGAEQAPGAAIPERGTAAGREAARAYVESELTAAGYAPERHAYRASGANVLAELKADGPATSWIVVGAHLDSVKNAGADDNATGSAAVLEVARVLKAQPDRRFHVLFAFFDEEELGLVGSDALARELKRQGRPVSAVHTLDMVGFDRDGDRAVEIERPDGDLWERYVHANRAHGLNLPLSRTNSGDTDHVAFRRHGFASVGMCEEWVGGDTTPDYHKKTDRFETVSLPFLTAVTRLNAACVSDQLAGVSPQAAARLPHDRFPGRARPFHDHDHAE